MSEKERKKYILLYMIEHNNITFNINVDSVGELLKNLGFEESYKLPEFNFKEYIIELLKKDLR